MSSSGVDARGLRERLPQKPEAPQKAINSETAQATVRELNAAEQKQNKDEKDRRTYGRTPDGTVFTVPHTEDMVSQLFDPTQPKNASDIFIVVVLASMGAIAYLLPSAIRIPWCGLVFIFWRMCYNAGIGWLLHNQSHYKRLVVWAKTSKIFENPANGDQPRPKLWKFLKYEMEAKIPKDYKFEDAPIEYNTWLLFRRLVDLILMCDFVSYCLFAIACGGRPTSEKWAMTIARWIGGWALIIFNLWVKLDAHRVVKDFAWYWGDFFFLIDQELTFDGVFELAPHPMYSVGYAGFYGISMLAASYKVLFISILGHAAQLIFLALVENPHIQRTYNSPQPLKRSEDVPSDDAAARPASPSWMLSNGEMGELHTLNASGKPSKVHQLIGVQNVDLHRITDVSVIVVQVYLYTFAFLSPSTWPWQALFVLNATIWRLWYSIGIGFILNEQSNYKAWTRHFVKYGDSTEEAWRQWKGIYHFSMLTCYTSFVCAVWKMYGLPEDWTYGMSLLRHVIGFALIALQLWTVSEIYESLGEFGWFFGDFFFDAKRELTYGGIYRFLNNPERTIGLAGVWGAAILTWSKAIFFLALLSHGLTLCFIQFVEKPHMQKLYRRSLRQTSGVSRNLATIIPSPLQKWSGSMDRVLDDGLDFVEDFIEAAKPKLASEFSTFVRNSRSLFKQFPARISITRLAPDLEGYDPLDYSLVVDSAAPGISPAGVTHSAREGESAQIPLKRTDSVPTRLVAEYGVPIRVKWTAPLNHSKRDWVGLYMIGDNSSREVTKVATQGRWTATCAGVLQYVDADEGILVEDVRVSAATRRDGEKTDFLQGEMEFKGDKLWWTSGVFEFRYHHDGKYNVMAISRPFEISISPFHSPTHPHSLLTPPSVTSTSFYSAADIDFNPEDNTLVEAALLPVVQNCFDRDPNVAPRTVTEHFGPTLEREGKYARRVVYAVSRMFGIDFAPEVVAADGNVRNLAWRICSAKRVLAPYSMSVTGPATPA